MQDITYALASQMLRGYPPACRILAIVYAKSTTCASAEESLHNDLLRAEQKALPRLLLRSKLQIVSVFSKP